MTVNLYGFFLAPNQILVILQIMLNIKGTSLSDMSLMLEEMCMKFKGEAEHLKQNYSEERNVGLCHNDQGNRLIIKLCKIEISQFILKVVPNLSNISDL